MTQTEEQAPFIETTELKVTQDFFASTLTRSVTGPEHWRLSQPIRFKTRTNHDLTTRIFPRFW